LPTREQAPSSGSVRRRVPDPGRLTVNYLGCSRRRDESLDMLQMSCRRSNTSGVGSNLIGEIRLIREIRDGVVPECPVRNGHKRCWPAFLKSMGRIADYTWVTRRDTTRALPSRNTSYSFVGTSETLDQRT
jgi:hypothetical protein